MTECPDGRLYSCSLNEGSAESLTESTPLLDLNATQRCTWYGHERLSLVALGLLLITGSIVGTYLLYTEGEEDITGKFSLVTKKYWSSETPKKNISKLTVPVHSVLFLETNTTGCSYKEECASRLRSIQKEHIDLLGEPDILYNFIIGGDGRIYEGRGWQNQSGNQNISQYTLTVAFLGNYDDNAPSTDQVEALEAFLDYAVMKTKVLPCFEVLVYQLRRRNIVDVAFKIESYMKRHNVC